VDDPLRFQASRKNNSHTKLTVADREAAEKVTTHAFFHPLMSGIIGTFFHWHILSSAGLYLQVHSASSKSWIFRFKRNGRARDMGLGPFAANDDAAGLTLAKARDEASRWRKMHKDEGKDPIAERITQEARKAAEQQAEAAHRVTFKEAAEELIESNEAGWKNAKHRQQWRNTLKTYAYPLMGDVAVADVDTELVLKMLRPLWTTKTETASRVRGRIDRVLSAAKVNGYRSGDNPAVWRGHLAELLPKRSKVRKVQHHPALDWRKVPAFIARLRERDGFTPRALELTVLTAVRTSETRFATFNEFDLANRTWIIPPGRMKADEEHRVPLCDRAVAIVKEMAETKINELVFPGIKQGKPLSENTMLKLLQLLHSVHGFRSSFRDWAGEATNHPHDVCEAALGHIRERKVHGAYQRGDLFAKRRKLMQDWAGFCDPSAAKKVRKRTRRQPQRTPKARKIRNRANLPIPEPIPERVAGA
jgi:integrase